LLARALPQEGNLEGTGQGYSKRDDAEQLYRVAGSAPRKEVTRLWLLDGIDTFSSPDSFDHIAQRRVHKALVQRAAAHAFR
jgi:hypothetical protein